MVFGLLKDIKNGEYRTIATPGEIATIVADGHTALVQRGAGEKAGFEDAAYAKAGAELVDTMEEIYARADFVTKVKELEPCEFPLLRAGQIIFTCIHPAAHPEEVQAILDSKCIAFTAEDSHRYGSPNCEAAGKQGSLFGLESMLSINGGKGKFVSGLGGAPAMRCLILGGGTVGQAALSVLYALGAQVTVMDINIGILRTLKRAYQEHIDTMICTKENIAALLPQTDMGIISIIPAILAIALSFATKNTIAALAATCITGTVLSGIFQGQGLVDILLLNFPKLLKENLGTTSFSWVMLLNTLIGILVAYFQKTGAIQGFSQWVHEKHLSRRGAQLIAWVLGMFVYFSDSFSPLFVGCTMRSITDKARISREKLAYIADSTSAPVSVLVPITGWAAYLSGLAIGVGCIATQEDAAALFLKAVPLNFYALFAVLFVGLIGSGIVKDFGPMKKAEQRAMETGKVLADGAQPLTGKELTNMEPYPGFKPRVFLNFLLPVLIIITVAMSTYIAFKSAKTMEAFTLVVILMSISMMIQGIPFKSVMETLMDGIKGALPAVVLLALAYSVNGLSKTMGTANYIISITEGLLTPHLLPAVIFVVSAIMAFATGSSWDTFAICMPIALPMAFSMTGGELTTIVVAVFAAVAGGGVFGDHCSPLSDTTILSSMGSASDHLDHVKTQLPYALICGSVALAAYLIVGFAAA